MCMKLKYLPFIVALIICLTPSYGFCGGFPIHVVVDDFEAMGNDEFKVTLSHVDDKLPKFIEGGKPIIFHLRNAELNNDVYLECINIVLRSYQNGDPIYISTAVTETIPGKVNEFQGKGLFIGKGKDRSKLDTVTVY